MSQVTDAQPIISAASRRGRIDVADGHRCSCLDEPAGNRRADALRSPADEGPSTCQGEQLVDRHVGECGVRIGHGGEITEGTLRILSPGRRADTER